MSIANFSIPSLVFLSITILLLFRLLHLSSNKLINRTSVKHWVKKTLFALELIVWITLIYQLAEKSINKQPVLSVVMILLLIFIAAWSFWFVLRDYFAGIYIRISGRFTLHETIAFNDAANSLQTIKGKIIRFTNQNLVLEQQNHTIIEIPYNKLFNKKIERHVQSTEEELRLVFEMKTPKDKEVFIEDVNKQLLELPWVNHNQDVKIAVQKQEDSKNKLELKIVLVDKKYRNRVEEILRQNFEK